LAAARDARAVPWHSTKQRMPSCGRACLNACGCGFAGTAVCVELLDSDELNDEDGREGVGMSDLTGVADRYRTGLGTADARSAEIRP
jgi:hypothetical protein